MASQKNTTYMGQEGCGDNMRRIVYFEINASVNDEGNKNESKIFTIFLKRDI